MSRISTGIDIGGDFSKLKTQLASLKREVNGVANYVNKAQAELKIKVNLKEIARAEREAAAAAARISRQQLAVGRALASGANPASAIAGFGPQAAGALAIAAGATQGLGFVNAVMATRAARRRGDIEGEIAGEKAQADFLRSIPIFGALGGEIADFGWRNSSSGQFKNRPGESDQEALDRIKQETAEQEKFIQRQGERIERTQRANQAAEQGLKILEREVALRGKTASAQGALTARWTLDDVIAAQDRDRGEKPLTESQVQLREALGREVSRERGLARRAEGTARTRAFTQARVEQEQEDARIAAEIRERGRQRNAERGAFARLNVRLRREQDELAEAQRAGSSETRQLELRAQGRSGAAEIEAIREGVRRGVAEAQGDPELEAQARRQGVAQLQILQNELNSQRRAMAETVADFGTTDLRARFTGQEPAKETNEILRGQILNTLKEIRDGGARMS